MAAKMKYMLYSGEVEGDDVFISGLFQWRNAFQKFGRGGELSVRIDKDAMEEFDIVHVNYTPANPTYITSLRNELGKSDTKLIVNVDYAINMWNTLNPHVMKQQLDNADLVFHVESNGAERLSRLLGKNVPTMPHPVDIDSLKAFRKNERFPLVTCQYHRYFDTWCEYYYGLDILRKKNGQYEEYMDTTFPNIDVVLMNHSAGGLKGSRKGDLFTKVQERVGYAEYIIQQANALINIDITHDYTYGRGVVDCAALGVPTIGSRTIEAQRRIWPMLAVEPGNDADLRYKTYMLLTNDTLRDELKLEGEKVCEYYSLESSYIRMIEEVERL